MRHHVASCGKTAFVISMHIAACQVQLTMALAQRLWHQAYFTVRSPCTKILTGKCRLGMAWTVSVNLLAPLFVDALQAAHVQSAQVVSSF